jgi:hypothetical protein
MPKSGSAIRPSEAARPHTGSADNPKLPPHRPGDCGEPDPVDWRYCFSNRYLLGSNRSNHRKRGK